VQQKYRVALNLKGEWLLTSPLLRGHPIDVHLQREGATTLACGGKAGKKGCNAVARRSLRTTLARGEGQEGQAPLSERETREKRQSEAASGQPCLRRRTRSSAGKRGSLANSPRRFHFCARFTRGYGRAVLATRHQRGDARIPLTCRAHITRDVCSTDGEQPARAARCADLFAGE